LATRIFFLVDLYSIPFFDPRRMVGEWTMGVCLYVWNPWERWGQVYYPYIKICQKISSVYGQQFITHNFCTNSRMILP
jgi:hypothetical protein